MTRIRLILISVASCFLLVATEAQDKSKPDIRGTITKVTPVKNAKDFGFILVEGPKGQAYDKASIRLTFDVTKVFKLEGKERKAASFKDLQVGAEVEAKFVGPVAESYPVQARGGEIVILPEEKK